MPGRDRSEQWLGVDHINFAHSGHFEQKQLRRIPEISCKASDMTHKPVFVTQPFLPPLEEIIPYLEQIWKNRILTNGGPMHQQLEQLLCDYLGVRHISLFSNGTIALMTAIQALNLTGEVITTPYSFVATSHALLWNQVRPVFVDIDRHSLNIDAAKIEAAITPDTTGILGVHCYGNPCDVNSIQKIADDHGLKVIYDAAHAFGVKDEGGSVLNHGDLSVLSLHATKVFNTFEGGAIICPDEATKTKIDQLKNFGIVDETTVSAAGLNGKMSEFNAAIGIVQLKYVDDCIAQRKQIDNHYRTNLKGVTGIRCLEGQADVSPNYAYFPILVGNDYRFTRDSLFEKLMAEGIYPRRYFYPLISAFAMYSQLPSSQSRNLPTAIEAAAQVLCLPIYPDMEIAVVEKVCRVITSQ